MDSTCETSEGPEDSVIQLHISILKGKCHEKNEYGGIEYWLMVIRYGITRLLTSSFKITQSDLIFLFNNRKDFLTSQRY